MIKSNKVNKNNKRTIKKICLNVASIISKVFIN